MLRVIVERKQEQHVDRAVDQQHLMVQLAVHEVFAVDHQQHQCKLMIHRTIHCMSVVHNCTIHRTIHWVHHFPGSKGHLSIWGYMLQQKRQSQTWNHQIQQQRGGMKTWHQHKKFKHKKSLGCFAHNQNQSTDAGMDTNPMRLL